MGKEALNPVDALEGLKTGRKGTINLVRDANGYFTVIGTLSGSVAASVGLTTSMSIWGVDIGGFSLALPILASGVGYVNNERLKKLSRKADRQYEAVLKALKEGTKGKNG